MPLVLVGTRREVSLTSEAFLTEDCTQQFFFRSQLGFALGRYLAHQDVAGVYLGTDIDDAGLVQLRQCALTNIGNIEEISSEPSLVSAAIQVSS